MNITENSLKEGRLNYYSHNVPREVQDLCSDFENGGESAADLRALGVYLNRWENKRVRLARNRESMPKTGIWVDENGKYCSEHYSSKPGLERYGFASFDTPQELFRHIWLRIVKNGIPASLMSKRNVNEKIDFDELFPPGRELSMISILNVLKPILGGEKLAHPSNKDLLSEKTIQRLIELKLIGKSESSPNRQSDVTVVRDLTKGGKIKYYFYCSVLNRINELYGNIILKLVGGSDYVDGRIFGSAKYEAWTVTNSQRMPINSVNFRTGENILICRINENEMFSAVFVAIIKRTFKRAKGKGSSEKLIYPSWRNPNPELIEELNDLLSDYFYSAAEKIDPTVFIDFELENEQISENARALLIKYLIKNGSLAIKQAIGDNSDLYRYVDIITKHEDLDSLTMKLINVSKSLRYV